MVNSEPKSQTALKSATWRARPLGLSPLMWGVPMVLCTACCASKRFPSERAAAIRAVKRSARKLPASSPLRLVFFLPRRDEGIFFGFGAGDALFGRTLCSLVLIFTLHQDDEGNYRAPG